MPGNGRWDLIRRLTVKVESGTKQGDQLSTTVFSVAVHVILKQPGLRGNISTHSKQVLCPC